MYDSALFPKHYETPDGKIYPIHTDFREWIRYESLISDGDVPENLKTIIALRLVFADKVPDDFAGAVRFTTWFYCGGKEIKKTEENENYLESRRVYDLEYDSEYIYAAFMELYGIDLSDISYLHWWKFRALFKGLHDCRMTDIMGYRGAEISEDLPDSRKRFLLDMQELYALPVSLAERRRIEQIRQFLGG